MSGYRSIYAVAGPGMYWLYQLQLATLDDRLLFVQLLWAREMPIHKDVYLIENDHDQTGDRTQLAATAVRA